MGVGESKNVLVFSKEELSVLLKNFNQLDTNNSGFIEPDELLNLPELKNNPIVERIIRIFDENEDGCISFYEFINGLTSLASASDPMEKYRFVFKIYDMNNDEVISNGDLFKLIKLLVKDTLSDVCIQQIVDRTMQAADLDKDGVISLDEFMVYVQRENIQGLFSMKILDNLNTDE